jgi:uncharacterized protein (DUF433 family)
MEVRRMRVYRIVEEEMDGVTQKEILEAIPGLTTATFRKWKGSAYS